MDMRGMGYLFLASCILFFLFYMFTAQPVGGEEWERPKWERPTDNVTTIAYKQAEDSNPWPPKNRKRKVEVFPSWDTSKSIFHEIITARHFWQ